MANSDNLLVSLLLGTLAVLVIKPDSIASLCSIEKFGNTKGGMKPISSAPLNEGGIRFGNTREEYEIFQDAVNASIPTKKQLERISNLSAAGGKLNAYVPIEESFATIDFGNKIDSPVSPCSPNVPTWDSASLLPKSAGNGMGGFQFNEEQAALLASQSWLTAAERIGINTTLGSLRNSSQDLRGDPYVIKMTSVSPWNNSTIYPDLTRRPLQGVPNLDPSYKQTFKEPLGMFT